MTIKTTAKEYFHNKWWKIYTSDFLLVVLMLTFAIYARYKISTYLSLINSYSTDFEAIQGELINQTATGAYKLQAIMSQVSPIVEKLNFFVFFIVPAIIFLIWVIFITFDYMILRKEKIINILPAMFVITIPFYLVFMSLANKILAIIRVSLFSDWKLYLILCSLILLSYLLHVSYSLLAIKKIKVSIKDWLVASVYRFTKSFPIFFLHSLSYAMMFGSTINIAIKYVTGSIGSAFWSFVVALISLLLIGLTRSLFHSAITK